MVSGHMADVKSYNCFPTVISQFSLNIEHAPMMECIPLSSDQLHEDGEWYIGSYSFSSRKTTISI